MNTQILILAGGCLVLAAGLVLYWNESLQTTYRTDWKSHQIPMNSRILALGACIVIGAMAYNSPKMNVILAGIIILATAFIARILLAVALSQKSKHMEQTLPGRQGVAATDFKNDRANLAGDTACGKILVGNKCYRAYQDLSETGKEIREGDQVVIKGINHLTACVTFVQGYTGGLKDLPPV